jgi:hypothetical protein
VTEAAAAVAASPRALQHPGCLVAGALAQQALFEAGIDGLSRARVASIISAAEDAPQPDREAAILRDADALSFFSLASGGFLDFHGTEPARIEVRRALARLSPGGRARLARVRLRRDIEALVQDARAAAA